MIGGKILVWIEDHRSHCPHVRVGVRSCWAGAEAADSLQEDAGTHLFLQPGLLLSERQMRMPEGSRFLFAVTCSISYHQSYEGEWDSGFEVTRVRTLYAAAPTPRQIKRWKFQDRKVLTPIS